MEVCAGKFPLERFGDLFIEVVESQEAVGYLGQAGELIRGEHLSLDDGEINLHLVEPTGMNGQMDQDQVAVFSLEPPHGGGTPMGGAIIHNPENPVRLPIGLLFHDLLDQPTKRFDAGRGFATAKHLGVDSSVLRAYPPS